MNILYAMVGTILGLSLLFFLGYIGVRTRSSSIKIKRSVWISIALIACVLAFFTYNLQTSSTEGDSGTHHDGEGSGGDTTNPSTPKTWVGWVATTLAYLALTSLVVFIFYQAFTTSKGWAGMLTTVTGIAAVAVISLNLLLAIAFPEVWEWFAVGHKKLFFLTNICALLFAFFWSKNNFGGRLVAILCLLIVIASAVDLSTGGSQKVRSFTAQMTLDSYIPKESVLRAICQVESGCQQFEKDGKTVLRGEIDPDDTGMFQINRRIHAALIKETGLDPDTLEGNIKLTNVLYEKYGTRPWNKSKEKWQKLLQAEKRLAKPFVLAAVEVPREGWSEKIENPMINGTRLRWGPSETAKVDKCQVMLNNDPTKIHPLTETNNNIFPNTLQFQCNESAGVEMRVWVVPN